jgi:hypothetical protein
MHRLIPILFALAGFTGSATAAPVFFLDTTMGTTQGQAGPTGDWELGADIEAGVGTGTCDQVHSPSGGNPGSYLRGGNLFDSQVEYALLCFHHNTAAGYVPAQDGAIDHVDYSIDVECGSSTSGGCRTVYAAIRQGTDVFVAGPQGALASQSWTNMPVSDLVEGDFILVRTGQLTILDHFDDNSHPDFSETGGIIELGFANWGGSFSPVTSTAYPHYDNWSMSIHPVPEPDRWLMVCAGCLLLRVFAARRDVSWAHD